MGFNRKEASQLLAACHRRCCICHRFCGIKIELDHIIPSAEGGDDSIDNAIPVCFECHAEIHLYNDQHPRGRKFRPDELTAHKSQWLQICRDNPLALTEMIGPASAGPIQSLIDELDFNAGIASRTDDETIGACFLVSRFQASIDQGLFSLLPPDIQTALKETYATLLQANVYLNKMGTVPWGGSGSAWAQAHSFAQKAIAKAQQQIPEARESLLAYLGHNEAG